MQNPIAQSQLPQCTICKLDPVPQSTQHIILTILQIALLFVNWKFSIILLMIGYSFPRTVWKCPFCTREIDNIGSQNNIGNSIILRMGNCMALFSLNKFRVFTTLIVCLMVYLFMNQPKFKPKVAVTKTWSSLVDNCGYQVYMENSVRSNHFYAMYLDSGFDWELQGIFLQREQTGISTNQHIYVKMNPSQFKDADAYDFKIFTKVAKGLDLNRGDVIKIKGQWQGRYYHNFLFNSIQINKTGQTRDPASVQFFYKQKSMLRSHLDSVISKYKQQQKIVQEVKVQSPEQPKKQQQQVKASQNREQLVEPFKQLKKEQIKEITNQGSSEKPNTQNKPDTQNVEKSQNKL